jgi:ubiquinone/menaquinone biosynthesis C-methylase UbiE
MNNNSSNSFKSRWDQWHKSVTLPREPLPMALHSLEWLIKKKVETILELGFGQLNDARFFAHHGYKVHGLDFSTTAVALAQETISKESLTNITVQEFDYSSPLPFPDRKFDAAYSHFSLHYFDQETTFKIFSEIRRILKREGLFIFSVKSVTDWKYQDGNQVGPDMFDDSEVPGHIRHFFCRETLTELLEPLFNILKLEEYFVYYHDHDSEGYEVIATAKE